MSNIKDRVDEQLKSFLTLNEEELSIKDQSSSLVNGNMLDSVSSLIRDYCNIQRVFTFVTGEDLDFKDRVGISRLIEELGIAIESPADYNISSLQAITVLLQLYVDVEITNCMTARQLIEKYDIETLVETLPGQSFDSLYGNFISALGYDNDDTSKKIRR